jgi:hypothetical protein
MARLLWNKAIHVVGVGGQFWIFAISPDRQLIYKYWDGAAWQPSLTGWASLGNDFTCISAPSAAARTFSVPQLDVVVVGIVNQSGNRFAQAVMRKFWNGSAWEPQTGWDQVGVLADQPPRLHGSPDPWVQPVAMTAIDGPNQVDVVAVGAGGEMLNRYLAGGGGSQQAAGSRSAAPSQTPPL